jgi:catechol 2,3-dioxygenase-like lactoylglutathione lyase family enzyme
MITGVQDFYYNVQDMTRAVAFYRDVLGLRVVIENEYWTSLDCAGAKLGLHWTEGGPVPQVPRDEHGAHAGGTLTLKVADLRAAVKTLRAKGVKLLGEISDNPWGSLVTFEDPDGNVLKLMQPPKG